MQRKFEFGVDEYYHIYNRGTDKRLIFADDSDRDRFTRSLFLLNNQTSIELRNYGGQTSVKFFDLKNRGQEDTLVDIGAYCLMPNHFHLLVREKEEGGLSRFMLKLLTSYSMYFNLKHKRTGALFESRFKAKHVDNDNYLRYLYAYIHLNPIKIAFPTWPEAGIANMGEVERHLDNYQFSSYHEYAAPLRRADLRSDLRSRPEGLILNREAFPEYFQQPADFSSFLADWVRYQKIEE